MIDEIDDALEELPQPGIGRAVETVVQIKTAGQRLDQYLHLLYPDFSRSILQRAIEASAVTVMHHHVLVLAHGPPSLPPGDRERLP